jgi:hypothetical protein
MRKLLILPFIIGLSACVPAAPGAPPSAAAPMETAQPPYPPAVLRALPAGVSLTAVKVSNGCYFLDTGAGPQPMTATTTTGTQPICG